jgi:NitT/TauT family transport system ATP-binding protein
VVTEIAVKLPEPRSQKVRFTAAFTVAERTASEALGLVAPDPDAEQDSAA